MNEIAEETVSKELEREAVTALIMSDKAVLSTREYIDLGLFSNFLTKNVAQWCLEFFDKYGKSPKLHIKDLYEANKSKVDDATAELIELFLVNLSDTFASQATYNEDFATERLVEFLNLSRAAQLLDNVGDSLDRVDAQKVIDQIQEFQPIKLNSNPMCSYDDLLYLAEDRMEMPPLMEYPGALGQLLGPVSRSSFNVILATEKRGKSQFMLYFAKLAAKKKRRVLFISAGDMTLEEISERERLAATGMNQKLKEPQIVFQPVLDCRQSQTGSCMEYDFDDLNLPSGEKLIPEEVLDKHPDHTPCTKCRRSETNWKEFKPAVWWEAVEMRPVSKETINAALMDYQKQFKKLCGKNGKVDFLFFATKTCQPEDIESELKKRMEAGEPVDVLVLDYMDILAAPNRARRMDERNQINATWEEMRRISQVYDLALITATQGNRSMYDSDAEQGSTSEDKRKAAHVTCMYALNQKPYEKEQGLIRVGVLFKRDGDANLLQEATVLHSFSLGKVHIASFLTRKKMAEHSKANKNQKDAKHTFKK